MGEKARHMGIPSVKLAATAIVLWMPTACNSTTPSARVQGHVNLPIPQSAVVESTEQATPAFNEDGVLELSARSLIVLAFTLRPDVASSFEAFKAEEARYDFFYSSHDALTPNFRAYNSLNESRTAHNDTGERVGSRSRRHGIEAGIDKQFFDTTRVGVSAGLDVDETNGNSASQPFLLANVRYPLGESREKLERTSEDIYRRNELNDAQLDYIQQVREKLEDALERFYEVLELRERVVISERWRQDLLSLARRLDAFDGRDVTNDQRRVEAEMTRVGAKKRDFEGRFRVEFARLMYECGVGYDTEVELVEEPFNPFDGISHEELIGRAIETDPEIATLRNAMRNAEVQLHLAQRGKWDIALLLESESRFRGNGAARGDTDWSVSAGLEVSAVDARVTGSLQRQARASIARFKKAIKARESLIYADTLEPLVRIETLSANRNELIDNLSRFQEDYRVGVSEFFAGNLNIDDLLMRREVLFEQEDQITELANFIGANVTKLCAVTGKFFELLGAPAG